MSRFASLLFVSLLGLASAAAAEPSELTRTCIAASTQAQTERDEGHLLAARAQFLSCAREECPAIVKKSCGTWLSELAPRIPSVVVRVHEADQRDVVEAQVAIDGGEVPLDGRPVMLDPGTHTITVTVDERAPLKRTFLLGEREQARLLTVELPAPPLPPLAVAPIVSAPEPAKPPPVRPYKVPVGSWLLAGAGVAGITTFTALYIKAKRDLDALDSCSPTCGKADTDAGNRKTLAADVSLGIGIAALAGGTAWAFGSWLRSDEQDRAQFSLSPTRGGAFASFVSRY